MLFFVFMVFKIGVWIVCPPWKSKQYAEENDFLIHLGNTHYVRVRARPRIISGQVMDQCQGRSWISVRARSEPVVFVSPGSHLALLRR